MVRQIDTAVRLDRARPARDATTAERPTASWNSELAVESARGQVIVNGAEVGYVASGKAELAPAIRRGPVRVEAVLVDAAGRPGVWTFGFVGPGIRRGSIRPIAGEVAALTPESIAFRLRGRPGERAVFSVEGE
jgi:hypothetical protein